jgi:hypothetical protein
MKWFKHYTDAHKSLKLRALIDSYNGEGYAVWWICCEICGKEGKSEDNWRISGDKRWRDEIKRATGLDRKKIYRILKKIAKLGLIDKNELKNGNLSIPQMGEYCDDYSERVRRVFLQGTNNVPLDKIRIDKNRIDKTNCGKPVNNSLNNFYKKEKEKGIIKGFPK